MPSAKSKRPNIFLILPDEFRQRALGFRNEDPVLTPNLDQLASESLELEHVTSTYPVCSPYRGMLMTGRYPYENGVLGNCNSGTAQFDVRLNQHTRCLSDVMRDLGYDCGYVGKWHLDSPSEEDLPYLEPRRGDGKVWDAFTPPKRRHGFDYWYSYGCCDQHLQPHYWRDGDEVDDVRQFAEFSPTVELAEIQKFLRAEDGRRDPEKPFFLIWAMNPPHMPFDQVPDTYKALYHEKPAEQLLNSPTLEGEGWREIPWLTEKRHLNFQAQAKQSVADYFAQVSAVDAHVGEALKVLKDLSLDEETIFIFTSDHGELMGSQGLMYKGPWFKDALQVPFLIRWPHVLPAGVKETKTYINPPDLFPTLLGALGEEDKIPETVTGRNLSRELQQSIQALMTNSHDQASVSQLEPSTETSAETSSKTYGYYLNPALNARGIKDDAYFLVVIRNMHDEERYVLYDLKEDPDELHNIAEEKDDLVRKYRERLEEWLVAHDDVWLR